MISIQILTTILFQLLIPESTSALPFRKRSSNYETKGMSGTGSSDCIPTGLPPCKSTGKSVAAPAILASFPLSPSTI
ncbi:hypothetical protein O181_049548 [Austropuccinia psidii MF-1]|uniref:Secreted protein n=1 Tax=Austropuccinia psidii MF-1 TaxID=1389203 RepID=A0A9Q3E034_9BASI|nr:hypothetical protein [Austropuccinia psidii MF-1]